MEKRKGCFWRTRPFCVYVRVMSVINLMRMSCTHLSIHWQWDVVSTTNCTKFMVMAQIGT